jgi:hypothetical protein
MTIPTRFDRRHGKGAFLRLCAMLADPAFAYQQIGDEFGVTRQRIFALAKELGVDGKSAVTIERFEFVLTSLDASRNIPQLFRQ